MVGGAGGWINPLQTLSQGLVLTFRFTFDPELDNKFGSGWVVSGEWQTKFSA